MKHTVLSFSLLCLTLLPVCPAYASGENDFQAGLEAFKIKQYKIAIRLFNTAHRQGMRTASLNYNLAVSYFKLGKYSQAKRWFEQAREYPNIKYLAEYNLGLIALKQNNSPVAQTHFETVLANTQQVSLIKLAKYRLEKLGIPTDKSWSVFASIEHGQDNNVTVASNEAPSKKTSSYTDYYLFGSLQVLGTDKNGLQVEAYVLDSKYHSLQTENMQLKSIGLNLPFTTGNWQNDAGIDYLESTLGGKDFQQTTIYELKTKYPTSATGELRLRYRYYEIDSTPIYAELDGSKQRARMEFRQTRKNDRFRLYYEFETNDRNETPASTANYSPIRSTVRTAYTYLFTDKLEAKVDLAWRYSEYPRWRYTSTTGTFSAIRADVRLKSSLEISYYLNTNWFLTAKTSHTRNDSNLNRYSYKRQVNSISLNMSF
ncbi:MAG: tetratricopeptide repeat protein [Gammaproteobacteria bacterium]|nr:tetratricopeptide repeat protein [Gammaproteobacteria bacterium]